MPTTQTGALLVAKYREQVLDDAALFFGSPASILGGSLTKINTTIAPPYGAPAINGARLLKIATTIGQQS
jgi:hypothetical protein